MSRIQMLRQIRWGLLVMLLAANLAIGLRLYSQEVAAADRDDAYAQIKIFTESLEKVRRSYVDESKVSYESLVQAALRGMLSSLDPHCQFMNAEAYKGMREDTSGQFGGLGIEINIKDNVITIVAPMEDTPGFKAGLMPGDRIVEIDGRNAEGLTLPEAVKKLRGAPGTKVTLKLFTPRTEEFRVVELERAEIKVSSVKDARMLGEDIAYLRITQFSEPTSKMLDRELDKLREKGMKALILDVRNNPGGLLESAVEVSQKFLPAQAVIVSTMGRPGEQERVYRASGRGRLADLPLAVLVNSGSASASEIVAGALRDNRRAILVGEKTFGKGSVQSVLPVGEGAALRLTTAKYYTPANRVIHERGIEPDIVAPLSPEDWRKVMEQRAQRPGGESVSKADEVEDIPLRRATDALRATLILAERKGERPIETAEAVR